MSRLYLITFRKGRMLRRIKKVINRKKRRRRGRRKRVKRKRERKKMRKEGLMWTLLISKIGLAGLLFILRHRMEM
jgi:hypothetical protein